MPKRRLTPLLCGILCFAAHAAPAQTPKATAGIPDTAEQVYVQAMRESIGSPMRADLGEQASVRLDGELYVVPRESAIRLLTVLKRPVPPDFLALLMGPTGLEVSGEIRFVPTGFVNADQALSWTADDILDSLRDTVERRNAERLRAGLQEREVRGWIRAPRYNPEDHQLTWAALIVPKSAPRDSDGEITFHALSFGRDGYLELSIATSVQQSDDVGRMADTFLLGVAFRPDKAYHDVQPGDPRAPGDLAAAMGIDNLHKARDHSSLFASDSLIAATGTAVATVGGLSLFIYIQRHLRRRARRV